MSAPARESDWRDGWLRRARAVPTSNCGPRPAKAHVDLVVLHSISLPPGEYGGDAIEQLFTNRLDWSAHPYFESIRGLAVSTHFLIRRDGVLLATPLLAVLVLVEVTDVVFAVDSIPAIFAVTRDTFTVFAANAFSLLGLASLYFLLEGMRDRFRHLNKGLAVVLVFIGVKMLITDLWHVPTELSLAVIVVALTASVLASPKPARTDAR